MDLDTYRTRTRAKADETETGFYSTVELDWAINAACRFVYGKLRSKSDDLFTRPGTTGNGNKFNTVSGTQVYSMGATLKSVVRVEVRDSTSTDDRDYVRVEKTSINGNEGGAYSPLRDGYSPLFGYFLAGDTIGFKPVPDSAYTVRIWDIPKFTTLSAAADEPPFDEDYDELVCELAALDVLGSSGDAIFSERFRLYENQLAVLDDASHRDQSPQVMVMDMNEVGVIR